MNKLLKIVSPLLVIGISFYTVQALVASKPDPEKVETPQRLISLFVDEVSSEEVTLSVISQGEVKAKTTIDLISEVSGRIVSISDQFAEGAEFNKCSTLIKIDPTDYKVAVIRAEASVAAAEVAVQREYANAKIKKSNWNTKKKGNASDFALNKPQVAEAEAMLRAAKADLKEARLNVSKTEIKLPFKGRVLEKTIGIGQYISAGTRLGHVFSTDTVEIRLPLTDSQLTELDIPMGFMADQNNAPEVKFSAKVGRNQHTWTGRIVRTNASVDQQTRLIYAIAEVADPYGTGSDFGVPIAVGMFVTAEIAGTDSQMAFRLPRLALRNEDEVYVVNAESKLEIRTVEVLSTTNDTLLLTSGVQAGEKVVTSTMPTAVEGMEVQALERNAMLSQL